LERFEPWRQFKSRQLQITRTEKCAVDNQLQIKRRKALFSRLKYWVRHTECSHARINVRAALPAIKARTTGAHHAFRGLCPASRRRINFGRIDIVTNAVDHVDYMT